MTWNLYLGADFLPLFMASKEQIPQKVSEVFRQFLATNFKERAKGIAQQIKLRLPDIIGLQEAEQVELIIPKYKTVKYDFVELLQIALRDKGLHYEVVAKNHNFTTELPTSTGDLIRFLDRDVILIRRERYGKIINKQEANFKNKLVIKLGEQPIELLRGWSSIDLKVNQSTFRVVNTHLEAFSSDIQVSQGNELLEGPANTQVPILVVGDFNSNADSQDTTSYTNFIQAGFGDAWLNGGSGPGYTSIQDPDLLNAVSSLNSRIDFILYKNGWETVKAELVGEKQADRTPSGLWLSDHAGVVACFTHSSQDS